MGQNYGPIFRRLWTKVHQITSANAGEIVVCNADCRYLVPFWRYSRSKCKVVRNCAEKACFLPHFLRRGPPILDLVYKIAPISDHVLKFRGDRPRDRGDLAPNKKKQQQNNDCGCVIETGGPKNWQSKNCNVHS